MFLETSFHGLWIPRFCKSNHFGIQHAHRVAHLEVWRLVAVAGHVVGALETAFAPTKHSLRDIFGEPSMSFLLEFQNYRT